MPVVLTFGCPRSGTTYMAKSMECLNGVETQKLKEIARLHPCLSRDGLLRLSEVFCETRLVLVRTVRHPLDVVRSFYALRKIEERGGVGRNGDQRIYHFIRSESESTNEQIQRIRYDKPWCLYDVHVIEAKYECLADPDARIGFIRDLCELLPNERENRQALENHFKATFGKREAAAREGRLKSGTGVVLDKARKAWWEENLHHILTREGYES